MALEDTGNAIGAVTDLISSHLHSKMKIQVQCGIPDPSLDGTSDGKLCLFLYESAFDPSLKNLPLHEGQPPPLWLTLKYALTAYDKGGKSDTPSAQYLIGQALRLLQEASIFHLDDASGSTLAALENNPEELKVTFDELSPDLLSKIFQGATDRYLFAVGFQVRPILIAPSEPTSSALLVGIDYTQGPAGKPIDPQTDPWRGAHVTIEPSVTGPSIDRIDPEKFAAGDTVTVYGQSFTAPNLALSVGPVALPIQNRTETRFDCVLDKTLIKADSISADAQLVRLTWPSNGRQRTSAPVVGKLLPQLDSAQTSGFAPLHANDPTGPVFGSFVLKGYLLGGEGNDVRLTLLDASTGAVVRTLNSSQASGDETQSTFAMSDEEAIPQADYFLVLQVNGQQAKNSPRLTVKAP